MQHTKINNVAGWLREQFNKLFCKNSVDDFEVVDLKSIRVAALLNIGFSIIASIAIIKFLFFSHSISNAFYASLLFVFSGVILFSVMSVCVMGIRGFKIAVNDFAKVLKGTSKIITTNRGKHECN